MVDVPMQPTRQLADALFWDKVEAAKRMSDEERFFAGARLFDRVCRVMKDGIRHDFPDASEAEVTRILKDRLALARRLEGRSWRQPRDQ